MYISTIKFLYAIVNKSTIQPTIKYFFNAPLNRTIINSNFGEQFLCLSIVFLCLFNYTTTKVCDKFTTDETRHQRRRLRWKNSLGETKIDRQSFPFGSYAVVIELTRNFHKLAMDIRRKHSYTLGTDSRFINLFIINLQYYIIIAIVDT